MKQITTQTMTRQEARDHAAALSQMASEGGRLTFFAFELPDGTYAVAVHEQA